MIIVYSELKKLLPNLNVSGRKLADDFTLIGHFCAGYKELSSHSGLDSESVDFWYDLEVRAANRPDCLGYIGLATDLSAFYKINLLLPSVETGYMQSLHNLDIKISTPQYVKSLQATKLIDLKIQPSPAWLQQLLNLHNINPINNLVDITNYIMLLYGIPCHAFDAKKIDNKLDWTTSKSEEKAVTFDGTILNLQEGNLVIKSGEQIVSMSSIGGENSGIDTYTTEAIVEVAIYDPTRVHKDNRALNIQTEAGSRLEKYITPGSLSQIIHHIQMLVVELCHGKLTNDNFSFENYIYTPLHIPFDSNLPSKYAGTNISTEESYEILSRLGCIKNPDGTITPPRERGDITQEEDLVEEVIRIYGYNKIGIENPIENSLKKDITPLVIKLSESIKNILVELGYDEIRGWPLIKTDQKIPEVSKEKYTTTQNSMNDEYFTLRQSIVETLTIQADIYSRFKVPSSKIFEIGKIFYQKDDQNIEAHSLGIYTTNPKDLDLISEKLNTQLTWKSHGSFYETILSNTSDFKEYTNNLPDTNAYELTTQITELDANIAFDKQQNPVDLLEKYFAKIDQNILWSLVIKDYFFDQKTGEHKYTFTACYYNCESSLAKQIHLEAFDLV